MPLPSWFTSLFNTEKPVIAMAHIPALPGTPRYDFKRGIDFLIETVAEDVQHLVEGGVDAVMFCNEDDRPYVFQAGIEQIAAMTTVVCATAPKSIPYGVDFLWDPMAAMAIAHATRASFIREVLSGTYESDMGLWSPQAGETLRFRRQIGADNVRVFFNVVPEFASTLGTRSVGGRAHSAVVSCLADSILISGPMAGMEPTDVSLFAEAKVAVPNTPVLMNTGARADNIGRYLDVADGVVVGSSLKVDGQTWNPIDPARVEAFLSQVKVARQNESKMVN